MYCFQYILRIYGLFHKCFTRFCRKICIKIELVRDFMVIYRLYIAILGYLYAIIGLKCNGNRAQVRFWCQKSRNSGILRQNPVPVVAAVRSGLIAISKVGDLGG